MSATGAQTAAAPEPAARSVCYAHRHMTLEEYGLWVHAREVSHVSGVFYFSGRGVAAHFRDTRKHAIYRVAKSLADSGWFEVIKPSERDGMTGVYRAAEYRPLSHAEWAANHPGKCLACPENWTGTCPENWTGDEVNQSGILNSPVRISTLTCPENRTQIERVSRKGKSEKDKARKSTALVFDLPSWVPSQEWKDYEEMRKAKRKPMTPRAAQLVIKELDKLRAAGDSPAEVLNRSIVNSWTDVYPLKREARRAPTPERLSEIDYRKSYGLPEGSNVGHL